MTRIDNIIDILDKSGALDMGGSPWEPDLRPEDVDIHQVDWPRLFPGQRPLDKGTEEWAIYGDEWGVNADELRDILDPLESDGKPAGHEWDICAWYQPIHFHGYDFGIFIREDCMRRLARMIYGAMSLQQSPSTTKSQDMLIKALLRTAFSAYYHHELYHHKTECFGLRLHAVEKKSSYLPYFRAVYLPNNGTDNQLEESMANAFMYRDIDESVWVPSVVAKAARHHLMKSFPYDPPSYRLAPRFINSTAFEDGQRNLFGQFHEAKLNPSSNPDYWSIAPRINQSFFNIHSDIWTVVPKGQRSILPTTATPLRTCSTNDMLKICRKHGYELTQGGKGSHVKLKRPGRPTLIIPGGRDNLSPGAAKNILAALGDYRIQDLPRLL